MAKRHHFVPVTYLRQFTDDEGRIFVHRKDKPGRPMRVRPEATAFELYPYSQIADDGARDNERFEALFSELEICSFLRSSLLR